MPSRNLTRTALIAASLLAIAGCAYEVEPGASDDALVVTDRCEIRGFGLLDSGELVAGRIRGDETGASGRWVHYSRTDGFVLASPDWIFCRINGAVIGDFAGDATVNGASGYTYRVNVQDRREPGTPPIVTGTTTEVRTVVASRDYRPTRWSDGELPTDGRIRVTLPAELPVSEGNAGNGTAWVSYQRADGWGLVTCRYRGGAPRLRPRTPAEEAAGLSYHFDRCYDGTFGGDDDDDDDDDEIDESVPMPGLVAGSVEEVRWLRVHVQNGSHWHPSRSAARTEVSVPFDVEALTTIPAPDDYYRISVWDAAGTRVLHAEGAVPIGDLRVTQLD